MRIISIALVALLLVTGCSQKAEYNRNLEIPELDNLPRVEKPLEKTYIYVDKSKMGVDSYKSSTSLGEDDLKMDLGLYTMEGSQRFFKDYIRNLEPTNNSEALSTNALVIMPEIMHFSYGFYSADGFNIDAKPYVSYALNLTMYKNGKEIYRKTLSSEPRHYGELTFFGTGVSSYAQIGPILQRAIAKDYNNNAHDIIRAINSN